MLKMTIFDNSFVITFYRKIYLIYAFFNIIIEA